LAESQISDLNFTHYTRYLDSIHTLTQWTTLSHSEHLKTGLVWYSDHEIAS
jgi:hypothetical protein